MGRATEGGVIITTGLVPGDEVVTDGHSRLTPGAQVEVKQGVAAGSLAAPVPADSPKGRGLPGRDAAGDSARARGGKAPVTARTP